MRSMRKKKREITDPEKIRQIVQRCTVCRLGFCDNGQAYIVPMNFGFTEENGHYTFYFHSAAEGRKIDLIRQTGQAGFELDTGYQLHTADTACGHTAAFQSIIGSGTVRILEDPAEKAAGLQSIMLHNTGRGDWTFQPDILQLVCVFRLDAEELSCKEHT